MFWRVKAILRSVNTEIPSIDRDVIINADKIITIVPNPGNDKMCVVFLDGSNVFDIYMPFEDAWKYIQPLTMAKGVKR